MSSIMCLKNYKLWHTILLIMTDIQNSNQNTTSINAQWRNQEVQTFLSPRIFIITRISSINNSTTKPNSHPPVYCLTLTDS